MRAQLILGLAMAFAVTSGAFSDEMPHRKAGLWELTTQPPGMPHAIQSKLCLDASTDVALQDYGPGGGKADCSKRDVKREGNQTIIDSQCLANGSTVTTHTVLTWTGDTAYHMENQSHWDPPFMGKADHGTTQDAKWLGECPEGMAPGDMTMANGMTINILKGSMGGMPHP